MDVANPKLKQGKKRLLLIDSGMVAAALLAGAAA